MDHTFRAVHAHLDIVKMSLLKCLLTMSFKGLCGVQSWLGPHSCVTEALLVEALRSGNLLNAASGCFHTWPGHLNS